jgi:hypothetical protein
VKVVAKYNKMNLLILDILGKENPSVKGWTGKAGIKTEK